MSRFKSRQRGQAMVEFLVLATGSLVLLLVAAGTLGKLNDVRKRAQDMSRYLAWERIVWRDGSADSPYYGRQVEKTDDAARHEALQRLLLTRTGGFKSTDATTGNGLPKDLPALWIDHAGKPLLAQYDDARLTTAYPDARGFLPKAAQAFGPEMRSAGGVPLQASFAAAGGVTSGRASLAVGLLNPALDWLWPGRAERGFVIVQSTSLLTGAWNAEASSGVARMVAQAVPTAKARAGGDELVPRAATYDLKLYGVADEIGDGTPKGTVLDFGRIKPDVVPADRKGAME
ncbi:hypothetical protein [Trinickia mobilis]|uniref:hypothetical protein n=1 Tax=Trinickia mobilis TaxID=2816356 RepID=UPI001A8FC720|nr:hypothetical protein [Trinickia mobilis]